MPRPTSRFDAWAAARLHVAESELTIEKVVEGIPRLRDLKTDGPDSPMGGRLASHLDVYSDTEFDKLVGQGEELLAEIRDAASTADKH